MRARIAHLVRHPIKSAGHEPVETAALTPGAAFPFDRVWAVAHAAARLAEPPVWASKLQFLRGWGSPELMAVTCTSDADAGRVTLSHPRLQGASFRPDDPGDAARLIDWLRPLWPDTRPEPARVVRVPGQAMTDQNEPLVSISSLSSLAELSDGMGQELSIHRFRGNIWIEGLPPRAELELIGQEIGIGKARLRIEKPIGRCRATGANPSTGRQDADVMAALSGRFGHADFGVFARVTQAGAVALGDEVHL